MKNKELLLDILEGENYKKLKENRAQERKIAEEKRAAEKLQQEKLQQEKLEQERLKQQTQETKKADETNETEEEAEEEEDDDYRSRGSSVENSDDDYEDKDTKKEELPLAAEQMALNQAMMIAVTTSQPEMLEILLEAGANPDDFDKWYPVIHTIVDMRSKDLFHIVKTYVSNICVESFYGNLLHASARAGSLELMKEVYNFGVTKMTGCKVNGSSPLHDAVRCVPPAPNDKQEDSDSDGKVNKKDSESNPGGNGGQRNLKTVDADAEKENSFKNDQSNGSAETERLLMSEQPKYDFRIIKFLLEKGNSVNAKDTKSQTPLHEAAIVGNIDLINLLLKAGANKLALDSDRNTPWLYAAVYGHSHLYDSLLGISDIDSPYDTNNNRYIHKVAELGKVEALRFLLSKGANQLLTNQSDETPLLLAVQRHHVDCVKELLNHSNPGLKDVNASAPFLAALNDFRIYQKDVLDLFLSKGQDIDVLSNGFTPLLHNITNTDVMNWLLKHGANPDYITPTGQYALLKACESAYGDNDEILRLLLNHNADVTKTDMTNSEGLTPLQVVIQEANYDLARLCLIAGFSLCQTHDWVQIEETKMSGIITNGYEFKYFFEHIKLSEYGPVSLKGLSRLKVLKSLGHVDAEKKIKQLGLPAILEDFLNWEKYLALRENEYDRCVENLKAKDKGGD